MNKGMRNILTALFLAFNVSAASAFDMMSLMHSLKSSAQPPRHFTEQRYSELLLTPITLQGIVSYRDDKLIKHIQSPFDEKFTVVNDILSIERSGTNEIQQLQLDQFPPLLSFVTIFRSVLQGDLTTLQQHYHTTLLGTAERWRLQLRPDSATLAARIKLIEIEGDASGIRRFTIAEQSGDHSLLELGEALQ